MRVVVSRAVQALENRYSLLGGRMSCSGEECTVKVYAAKTSAETIAHEFSVLQYDTTLCLPSNYR